MSKVYFYLLPEADQESRWNFCARLVEKAYYRGHQVYLHTDHLAMAQALDKRLWQYRGDSFVPHALVGIDRLDHCPVHIGFADTPTHFDLLINLAQRVPDFARNFQRVNEVVNQDDGVLEQSRQHYRTYQQWGLKPERYDLRKANKPQSAPQPTT